MKKLTMEGLDRIIVAIVGPAGIGKTSLLETIRKDEKIFIISIEKGLLCVRDMLEEDLESGRVTGVEIEKIEDLKELQNAVNQNKIDARWIFIDSISDIAKFVMEKLTEKHMNSKDGFAKWNEYDKIMTQFIRTLKTSTGYNVIFTALSSVEKDESNRRYQCVDLQGGIKKSFSSYFDEYLFMKKEDDMNMKNNNRVFVTDYVDIYPAKDRSGCLDLYEKPDLSSIYTKIMKGKKIKKLKDLINMSLSNGDSSETIKINATAWNNKQTKPINDIDFDEIIKMMLIDIDTQPTRKEVE